MPRSLFISQEERLHEVWARCSNVTYLVEPAIFGSDGEN